MPEPRSALARLAADLHAGRSVLRDAVGGAGPHPDMETDVEIGVAIRKSGGPLAAEIASAFDVLASRIRTLHQTTMLNARTERDAAPMIDSAIRKATASHLLQIEERTRAAENLEVAVTKALQRVQEENAETRQLLVELRKTARDADERLRQVKVAEDELTRRYSAILDAAAAAGRAAALEGRHGDQD
jgi:hypothetical protein